ncbi:chromosome partitioning protein ParB [Sphingomonas echinoides]|uniref:Chromosome partitioning protein ParB n=1 Tax=Sphingomonas echinoides TaxID=59803 RepID=A0ABU4PJ87_9SPHN|nr:chromosome partitioning protein ParB [Sphingomonas echinoides]MDX5983695.1 hypothetical protein [Sphingomonas echinoides]
MAASNKNELPLESPSNGNLALGEGENIDYTASSKPGDAAMADSGAAPEIASEPVVEPQGAGEPDDAADGVLDEKDAPDAGEAFQPVPMHDGEFVLRLSELGEWQHHPKRGSRLEAAHGPALKLSAADPATLRPIVVLPAVDGVYPIVDGRFLWAAIREANAGNEDIEVRCVLFDGDEKEAVAAVCDAALGTIDASAIEKAQALLSLTQTNGISRTAIAERYAGLTISKVSNMLIAAGMKAAYPALFAILHEPDRAPISYGVELNKVRKAMGDDFQSVLDRAIDLDVNGERCKPAEAFDALQIEREMGDDEVAPTVAAKPKPIVPITSEAIFGDDDAPVAAYERLADNIDRIRLPDASAMSLDEREAAAEACIVQIRRHFGLDQQG